MTPRVDDPLLTLNNPRKVDYHSQWPAVLDLGTVKPISLVSKSGALIQDIRGVSSLRTKYTTRTT